MNDQMHDSGCSRVKSQDLVLSSSLPGPRSKHEMALQPLTGWTLQIRKMQGTNTQKSKYAKYSVEREEEVYVLPRCPECLLCLVWRQDPQADRLRFPRTLERTPLRDRPDNSALYNTYQLEDAALRELVEEQIVHPALYLGISL